MKKIILVLFLLSSAGCVGCSSVLYYPSKKQFYDPIQLKIQHEEIYFHAEDNVRLHGWYFPSRKKGPPKGLIVQFHGNAENISTHFMSVAWLTKHGYDHFVFDYRGYGKSQGEPSPEGTVKDGVAALRWAEGRRKERKIELPLVVIGQSLGGAISMRSVYELKGKPQISLLALESTFPSYQGAARTVMARSWLLWPFQWLPYLLLSDRWAPEDIIAKLSPTPILVLHSDTDPVVDYKLGRQVYDLALEPKEMWVIKGGQHIDAFWRHNGLYQKRFLERLAQLH